MIYRYYYEPATGAIFAQTRYPGTLAQPGKAPQGMGQHFVDSDEAIIADQYKVDTNTNTLVAKDQ